jgi:hypothetical protein
MAILYLTDCDAVSDNATGAPNVVALRPWAHGEKLCEADVERVNHYPLYELGKTFRRLLDAMTGDDIEVRHLFSPIRAAMNSIDLILSGTPFPLGISKRAALSLKNELEYVHNRYFIETKDGKRSIRIPDSSVTVGSWELSGIGRKLANFETIFSTEMGELATYFVPQRGIYSTAALIDFADQSFPPDIIGHVPEKAREDWKAAGRCLAFNLLSATGFHVARAVEATLEVYYQTFTGKSGELNGWYDYIKALNGVIATGASPAPTEKTLTELTQMKDDYRNPLVHPRVTLTEVDARMLFDNGESVIIAMAAEIKTAREVGGVQGTLAVVGGRHELDDEIPF